MPEGPTIVILRDELARFAGRKILHAEGNAKIDMPRLAGQRITALRSWGKHFLIELPEVAVRVHFLMFGSYTWSGDVMSDSWDAAAARRKLRAMPQALVCDALLDQDVFAGVGNIIKNEVLFRVRVHPLSLVGALPAAKLRAIVEQARQYSFEFLAWRRANVLRQHWQVHNKGICPSCGGKLTRAWLGKRDRRGFFCERCQPRHGPQREPVGARRGSKTKTRSKVA